MRDYWQRKTKDHFNLVVLAFIIFVCGFFFFLSAVNWFFQQDNAFYQRPSVTASSLHALRKMLFVILNPAASLPDSWLPMLAAYEVFISSGASIYEVTFFKLGVRFQYPPSSLLAIDLVKLLKLEPEVALPQLNIVFLFVFAVTSGMIAVVSLQNGFFLSPLRKGILFSIGFLLPLFFYPVIHALNMGQIQIWIDALIAASVLAWLKDRKTLSGAMAGLTCVFKPQASILLLWAIASRDWQFVRGFICVVAVIAVISIHRFGWTNHFDYLDVLNFLSKHGESFYANQSLMGLLHRLAGNGPNLIWEANAFPAFIGWIYRVTSLASLALFIFLIWLSAKSHRTADISGYAFAIILTILAAPIAWEHHYGAILPFFLPLLARALARDVKLYFYLLLGLAWVLTANYLPALSRFADSPLNFMQSYVFVGGMVFLFLTVQMVRLTADRSLNGATRQSILAAPDA
jgi:alpha-1,2-mannosyltransferase